MLSEAIRFCDMMTDCLKQKALEEASNGPILIDIPIDYKDNIKLGETILPDEFY